MFRSAPSAPSCGHTDAGSRLHGRSASMARSLLCALGAFLVLAPSLALAQTQIPLPPQNSTFSTNARGFWFTSPSNIVITGLRVPTDASAGPQSIELVRFNSAPPLFSATTNDFTSLFRVVDDATTNILPVSIPVATGEMIGVLGVRSNVNSYATSPASSTIDGNPVTLARLGMQFPLSSTVAQNLWTESSGSISRVEVYYLPGFLVSAVASPAGNGTVSCSPAVVASGSTTTCTATPSAGYMLTGISGCNGVAGTASPYTTGAVTAACTVTATFAEITYPVTAVASPTAGGTVSCTPAAVSAGGTATCTATPQAGYAISTISGCNGTASTTSPYTTGAITAACTVTAEFRALAVAPVPTLNTWMLWLLGGLLALLGARRMRLR